MECDLAENISEKVKRIELNVGVVPSNNVMGADKWKKDTILFEQVIKQLNNEEIEYLYKFYLCKRSFFLI